MEDTPAMTKGHEEALLAIRPEYKVLSDEQNGKVGRIKTLGVEMYEIFASSEPSREMSLAKTKLEEAIMWSVKAVTK